MKAPLLAASLLLASPAGVFARDMGVMLRCPESRVQTNLEVFFGNGMDNTLEEAEASLNALRNAVPEATGFPEKSMLFTLAFNYKESSMFEAWEVFKQRVGDDGDTFWDWLAWGSYNPWSEDDLAHVGDGDLEAQMVNYRRALRAGRNVLVVAHSQGNLYVKAAHEKLFNRPAMARYKDAFRVVGVASPSSAVPGPGAPECGARGCYTTLLEDLVIFGVRAVFGSTLPANFSDSEDSGDLAQHNFLRVYLGLPRTRARVLGQIDAQVSAFPHLDAEIQEGELAASLEWEAERDLDLHVYEADRSSHVYYDRTDGSIGYLDRDSRVGGGELENYFAVCEDLRPGSYEFAVGYFDGEGSVSARLGVRTGDRNYVVTRSLTEAQGAAADREPLTMLRLEVEQWDERSVVIRRVPL